MPNSKSGSSAFFSRLSNITSKSTADNASNGKNSELTVTADLLAASNVPLDNSLPSFAHGLTIAAIIIAGLYFGRELLMPLALAVLIGFVLEPIVAQLKRWGLPRLSAIAVVVITTLALVIASGAFVYAQLKELGKEIPVYQANVSQKFQSIRASLKQPGVVDQVSRVFGTVESELAATQLDAQQAQTFGQKNDRPTRVEVVPGAPQPLQQLGIWLESISTPLVTFSVVLMFVVLILLDRGDLRDRMLRLFGDNLHRTTDALDETTRRISRYLTMQVIVNAAYGLPLAVGLLIIGVPGALVWGILAAVLRFVPYVGPLIAALFPVSLAFAVDPGWSTLLWVVGLIVTLELVSNNLIEPWLYGSSTGLSTLSLIMATSFWTALWGPGGLILSTPLTVVMLVLGRHLPQLHFLNVLLGSEPALDAPTRLYQRLLANDIEEAVELAINFAEESSPTTFYAEAGIPALRLAGSAHGTVATAEHRHRLVLGMEQLIADFKEQYPVNKELPPQVICIGARWQIDALAAEMTAHALAIAGYPSRSTEIGMLSARHIAELDLADAQVVCLSYFNTEPEIHAKHFIKRLKARWPDLRIILAIWNAPGTLDEGSLIERSGAEALAISLEELITRTGMLLSEEKVDSFMPPEIPADEQQRLQALRDSGVLDTSMRGIFDAIAKRAADAFDCPLALVSLIDEHMQMTHGNSTSANRQTAGPPEAGVQRTHSICGHVVAEKNTLIVSDIARDPRFAANPLLRERQIRFYAGTPLRTDDGFVLGTLCLLDKTPRTLSPREVLLLEAMAKEVMVAVKTNKPSDIHLESTNELATQST
ncbi:MAG TPA: AI-2E family transporter [Accumulibacter sp.]|nr:AI-2E family transporter [Accumulibacter sp.]